MSNTTPSPAIYPTTDCLVPCFLCLLGRCLSSEDRTVSAVCSVWHRAWGANPKQTFGDGTHRWIPSQFTGPESSGWFQSTRGRAGWRVTACVRAPTVCWAVRRCHADHSCHRTGSSDTHTPVTRTRSLPCQLAQMCGCCSVTQSCLTLCNPMDCDTPGFPVHHCLLDFAQAHVYWISDAVLPSHPLSPPSPLALTLSQHQGLFQEICWCKIDTRSPSWMVSLLSTDPPLAKKIRLILSSSSKNEQNVPSMGLKGWVGGRKPVSNFVLIYLFNVIIY